MQQLAPGLARRVSQQPVAHESAVSEEVLHVGAAARRLRRPGKAMQAQRSALRVHYDARIDEVSPQQRGGALADALLPQMARDAAVMPQAEFQLRPCERDATEYL